MGSVGARVSTVIHHPCAIDPIIVNPIELALHSTDRTLSSISNNKMSSLARPRNLFLG